jgi:hypothetical protein
MSLVVATLIGMEHTALSEDGDDVPLVSKQSHATLALHGNAKIKWKEAVGRRVVAQGIAWGQKEKGLGDRVILDAATIYVAGQAPFEKQGRLVEVSGRLELKRFPGRPVTDQGCGPAGVQYYVISDAKWKYVDEVREPMLAIVGEE